jgi:hypothetical protein
VAFFVKPTAKEVSVKKIKFKDSKSREAASDQATAQHRLPKKRSSPDKEMPRCKDIASGHLFVNLAVSVNMGGLVG